MASHIISPQVPSVLSSFLRGRYHSDATQWFCPNNNKKPLSTTKPEDISTYCVHCVPYSEETSVCQCGSSFRPDLYDKLVARLSGDINQVIHVNYYPCDPFVDISKPYYARGNPYVAIKPLEAIRDKVNQIAAKISAATKSKILVHVAYQRQIYWHDELVTILTSPFANSNNNNKLIPWAPYNAPPPSPPRPPTTNNSVVADSSSSTASSGRTDSSSTVTTISTSGGTPIPTPTTHNVSERPQHASFADVSILRGRMHGDDGSWSCESPNCATAGEMTFCQNGYLYNRRTQMCHCGESVNPTTHDVIAFEFAKPPQERTLPVIVALYPIDPLIDISNTIENDGDTYIAVYLWEDIQIILTSLATRVSSKTDSLISIDCSARNNLNRCYGYATTKSIKGPGNAEMIIKPPLKTSVLPPQQPTSSAAVNDNVVVAAITDPQVLPVTPTIVEAIPPSSVLDAPDNRRAFVERALHTTQLGEQTLAAIASQFRVTNEQLSLITDIFDLDDGHNKVKKRLIDDVNRLFTLPEATNIV
jgi:hypothetical protein